MKKYILAIILAACLCPFLSQTDACAQSDKEDRDSLVRLISADSLQLITKDGMSYRRVVGKPARFLHNNTYLLCDTAIWNVDLNYIDAIRNVRIIQEETVLSGDKLKYLVDEDLAQFRGSMVQLVDKDNNTLRTTNLDYNTKDSVAVFRDGGSMRDKDGQIIESDTGEYRSKEKVFEFDANVNMFTDSVFVRTTHLLYESEKSLANFSRQTYMWKDDNMLAADLGWYNRDSQVFFFTDKVHLMTAGQEAWCDSMYYYRAPGDMSMTGNVQVSDTTRNVFSLSGRADYVDTLDLLTLTRNPAAIALVQEEDKDGNPKEEVDSVFFAADTIRYWTVERYALDSADVVAAGKRREDLSADPVSSYRTKAAAAAAQAAAEAGKDDPNNAEAARKRAEEYAAAQAAKVERSGKVKDNTPVSASSDRGRRGRGKGNGKRSSSSSGILDTAVVIDSASTVDTAAPAVPVTSVGDSSLQQKPVQDTAATAPVPPSAPVQAADSTLAADSLKAGNDSTPAPVKDSTKIGYLFASGNVRIFRPSMQVVCDSLYYTDIDSLARMYGQPSIWNEGTHQYTADSIFVSVHNGTMDKASFLSNAYVHIQEGQTYFDQIKSTEMMAFFEDGELKRFDALGGSQAMFFIKEKETIATVNKKDCKMLSAYFKDGSIYRVFYFDAPKSDASPLAQMTPEQLKFKGFNWTPERRPQDRFAITGRGLRPCQRHIYAGIAPAPFRHTDRYFPGYISDIRRQIAVRDSLGKVMEQRRKEEKARMDSLAAAKPVADSLARLDSIFVADSLFRVDSLARVDSIARADSLVRAVADSISRANVVAQPADTVAKVDVPVAPVVKSPEQIKAEAAAAEAARKAALLKKKAEEKAAKKAHRDSLRAEALARREQKWREQDMADSLRMAADSLKQVKKARLDKKRQLLLQKKQDADDQAMFDKYRIRFEKKKARRDERAARRRKKDENL